MTRPLAILFVVMLLACSSDEEFNELEGTSTALAARRAAAFCGVSTRQMLWLQELIQASQDDPALAGPVYAFRSNGEGVFMHQPWIMSCLGCIMYDCEGNRLDPLQVDKTELSAGFQNLTTIYAPKLE